MTKFFLSPALILLNTAAAFGQTMPPARAAQDAPPIDVQADGAFGFPQKKAQVLCDSPELRVSVINDDEYLFVQAVLWTDDKDELGETDDGRKIGCNSDLGIDTDADGRPTPEKDRSYSLNPWPKLAGLRYSIVLGESASTPLLGDSMGRGSLLYVTTPDGKKVRVDNFLIPLEEIGRRPGKKIRFAYWGCSPKRELTVNSIGFKSKKGYYPHSLPRESYHEYTLAKGGPAIDADQVPEGRETIAIKQDKKRPLPAVGSAPPELTTEKWINWTEKDPPTLKGLRGKVVMVEFWATWCGPCLAGVPHLNKLHEEHGKEGLVILSVAEQSAKAIEKLARDKGMKYVVGAGCEAFKDYGVDGFPHAFLIDRRGKVAWQGSPNDKELEKKIAELIEQK